MTIQIIPENRRRSAGQALAGGIAENLGPSIQQFIAHNNQVQAQQQENDALKRMGLNFEGLSPNLRKEAFVDALKGKSDERKFEQERSLKSQQDMDRFNAERALANEKFEQDRLMKAQQQSDEFNSKQSLLEQEYRYKSKLEGEKNETANQEKNQVRKTGQIAFDTLVNLLKKGNIGKGSGVYGSLFGGETSKDTGQFSSATGGLEAMLVDMVNRGTLSDSRFQYITETLLPKPTDRQKEIEGKLIALADILDLDPSVLTGKQKQQIPKKASEQFPGVGRNEQQKQSLADIWK
jgi:hypothetical protein